MSDRFNNYDDEVRKLVLDFENTVLRGETQFYDVDELETIIDYYFEVNDLEPLEKAVRYAEQLYPDNTDVRLRRAHLMIAHEQFAQALSVLNTMREMEPENTDVAYSLGVANGAVGDSKKAIAYFKEAAADGWMLGHVYSNMAEEYYKLKDYESSIRCYRKAMENDDCDETTIYNFYDVCFEAGQLERAYRHLSEYVHEHPYSRIGWYCYGCVQRDMSLYEEAVDAFEYAIAIDKNYTDAYYALSHLYELMGKQPMAVSTLLHTLDYIDDRAKVFRSIGGIYFRAANFETSIAYLRKSLEEQPLDAEALAMMANCQMDLGDTATAISTVKKALNIMSTHHDPTMPDGNPEVLCLAAMVYDAYGDFYMASELFDQMIVTDLCTEPHCQIYTQFLFNHKVYDILTQFAEQSLEIYPHSPFYSTFLAATYFYQNRYNRARKMLPDVLPEMLADLCPEIMKHPLLGPLVGKNL